MDPSIHTYIHTFLHFYLPSVHACINTSTHRWMHFLSTPWHKLLLNVLSFFLISSCPFSFLTHTYMPHIYTYIHACMPYIHTCHTYNIHACHTYVHTCHTYMHTIHTYIYTPCIHTYYIHAIHTHIHAIHTYMLYIHRCMPYIHYIHACHTYIHTYHISLDLFLSFCFPSFSPFLFVSIKFFKFQKKENLFKRIQNKTLEYQTNYLMIYRWNTIGFIHMIHMIHRHLLTR